MVGSTAIAEPASVPVESRDGLAPVGVSDGRTAWIVAAGGVDMLRQIHAVFGLLEKGESQFNGAWRNGRPTCAIEAARFRVLIPD